jgi:hypothetical protein
MAGILLLAAATDMDSASKNTGWFAKNGPAYCYFFPLKLTFKGVDFRRPEV